MDIKGKTGKFRLKPAQILVIGFLTIIFIGGVILNLPMASQSGKGIGFIDAMFTSTSAVCVTGLAIVDTGTHWSLFGKAVILILIQIGGLGFMTMATMMAVVLGKKITLKERLIIQEALNQNSLAGLVRFSRNIVILTFIVEGLGAFFLSFRFVPEYGWSTGIAYSVFHSISAFCNAGFDLIGNGKGLTSYVSDPVVSLIIIFLIIIGGLGFSVITDLFTKKRWSEFFFHSKIVILITGILLIVGFIGFTFLEWSNPHTLGGLSTKGKFLAGFFQSTTTRTAGFHTIDFADMTNASKTLTIMLMFIGGSPTSTAGGIKTTTFGIIIVTVISVIRGKEETELFKRRISWNIVKRAITIAIIGIVLIISTSMIISITDSQIQFIDLFFEIVSAFGTVGLSLGITSELSVFGKVLIMFLMFAGRVGILTIAFALAHKQHKTTCDVKYPKGKILIG